MVPQSYLAFGLEWLTNEDSLAAVVIMNGMTISLVGQNNNIIVMHSHIYSQLGGMVGIISVDKVQELLVFIKQQLSPRSRTNSNEKMTRPLKQCQLLGVFLWQMLWIVFKYL